MQCSHIWTVGVETSTDIDGCIYKQTGTDTRTRRTCCDRYETAELRAPRHARMHAHTHPRTHPRMRTHPRTCTHTQTHMYVRTSVCTLRSVLFRYVALRNITLPHITLSYMTVRLCRQMETDGRTVGQSAGRQAYITLEEGHSDTPTQLSYFQSATSQVIGHKSPIRWLQWRP